MANSQLKLSDSEMKLESKIHPILIVDDEESITQTLKSVLEDDKHKVLVAYNAEQALLLVKKERPFLVFLDMWMPGKDGLETLREIQIEAPETQVVMMSGHATITNALEAMKAGAFDFLEKPFAIKAVTSAVEKAIKRYVAVSDGDQESFIPKINTINEATGLDLTSRHPSAMTISSAGKNLGQRTLKNSVVLYGQCLHTGMKSGLVLEPLPKDSGIHFSHLGTTYTVPAFVNHVQSTALATTLMSEKVSASTIEHLMSALCSYHISNLLIKCNGEVPIFDGSAIAFCDAIESTGIEEQQGDWFEFAPSQKVEYSPEGSSGDENITIEPSEECIFEYHLNYPEPVGKQSYTFVFNGSESFKKEIAPARTFGFIKDVEHMQRMGLAAGGRLNNFILIGNEGVVNTDLRFSDELVRHKILDSIGDLFLLGRPLRAKITAQQTGHADNVSILKLLASQIKDIKI